MIATLDIDYHRENTMVIFLADHGEMLGEHGFMGHGFGVYEELLHATFYSRPSAVAERELKTGYPLRKFLHDTDYFGFKTLSMPYADEIDVGSKKFAEDEGNRKILGTTVISEAHAPENAIKIMNNHAKELISKHHADHTRYAVYQHDEN